MTTPTNAVPPEALVRFARRVSHDVNNFSTVVSTYSELLLADIPEESPAHADVQEIHAAAEQLVQYLQRVTRFARAATLRRTTLAPQEAIDAAVAAFRARMPERVLTVEGAASGTIEADATWLTDMVGELLTNAHEAAPAGSAIVLRIAPTDGAVVIEVRDEGSGPSSEIVQVIGEPFVTTKQGVRGAGMGLALVNAFAVAVGGRFTVTRDGVHTVAALSIPRAS